MWAVYFFPKAGIYDMALAELRNVRKKYQKAGTSFYALDDISFEINEGECLGLVGESGSGKSTAAGVLARLIKEDAGAVYFEGKNISSGFGPKPAGRGIQMVFQNPQDSFDPRDTLLKGVMQGAASYKIWDMETLEKKALEMIDYVGLKREYSNVRLANLSGGECQRAAIARALICSPKLIICDEATSALDVLMQAQIIDLLKKLKKEKGTSMLFITHDIPLTAALCDRIAVIHRGKIAETGRTEKILSSPENIVTKNLLSSVLTIQKNTR